MPFPKIVCVVPTCRLDRFEQFKRGWQRLFRRHEVRLLAVIDGEKPRLNLDGEDLGEAADHVPCDLADCFFNRTDSVRNYGFHFAAANLDFDTILTADDDILPINDTDPIADHLRVLGKRVPISWMNTGNGEPYFRGIPYCVRNEATVEVSLGSWVGTPDLDGPTQLMLTGRIDPNPSFYRGPIPKGVLYNGCGMWVAATRKALPYLYYSPMGTPRTPFNRFGDIWCFVALKLKFDELGYAVYTGNSIINHSRASDTFVNLAQEAEGLRYNELWNGVNDDIHPYFGQYRKLREKYAESMKKLLG